jgi:tRNA-2-methylthio-N6-dimethylallyladenosine synthase
MNVNESDILSEALSNYGLLKSKTVDKANLIIINTCSVREHAEHKAFSLFGRLTQQYKQSKIVVIGCMAEYLEQIIKQRFKDIDLIISQRYNNMQSVASKIIKILYINSNIPLLTTTIQKQNNNKIVNYITIIKGCSNYCAYCIVPFVKGNEQSLEYNDILKECTLMVTNGTREIVLLGQNVNAYNNNSINFSTLIKNIAKIKDLLRIRFMTNHPKDFTDELIQTIASTAKVCTNIHLPMQSASNKILHNMNRQYDYEYYVNLINKLRNSISNINITTDIIVGFPNETEKDFYETLDAIKYIKFGKIYVFKYSPRRFTYASKFIDNVSYYDKQKRHIKILEEAKKISSKIITDMVGSNQEILIESYINNTLEGKTKHGYKVLLSNKYNINLGKIINVKITGIKGTSLISNKIV